MLNMNACPACLGIACIHVENAFKLDRFVETQNNLVTLEIVWIGNRFVEMHILAGFKELLMIVDEYSQIINL